MVSKSLSRLGLMLFVALLGSIWGTSISAQTLTNGPRTPAGPQVTDPATVNWVSTQAAIPVMQQQVALATTQLSQYAIGSSNYQSAKLKLDYYRRVLDALVSGSSTKDAVTRPLSKRLYDQTASENGSSAAQLTSYYTALIQLLS